MVFTRASSSVWQPAQTHPPRRATPPSRKSRESISRSCIRNKRGLTTKEVEVNLRGPVRTMKGNFYSILTKGTRSPNFNSLAISTRKKPTRMLSMIPNQLTTSVLTGISAMQRESLTRSERKITPTSSSKSSNMKLKCSTSIARASTSS